MAAEPLSGGDGAMLFFPILVGVIGPAEAPDRLVLVNPAAGSMVVLQGDAAAVISGGGATRHGPPPASRASIEALKTVEAIRTGKNGVEECPVCVEELHEVNIVKEMPCRHRFHGGCIEQWLGMHGSCPVCRHRMPEEEEEEGSKKSGDGGEEEEDIQQKGFLTTLKRRRFL